MLSPGFAVAFTTGKLLVGQYSLLLLPTKTEMSISKSDLCSDLVGEYPELQGVMGKYF